MKKRWLSKTAVSGLTAGAAVVLAAGPAAAAGADNVVNVADTQFQPPAIRAAIMVAYDPGDVTNQNVAIARSFNCSGCEAFAAGVQFVIVEGHPPDVQPANAASASNSGCYGCQTFAYAYQDLIYTDGQVHLAPGTESRLSDIEAQMEQDMTEAGSAGPSAVPKYADLESQLNSLTIEAEQLVQDDLVAGGHAADLSPGTEQMAQG